MNQQSDCPNCGMKLDPGARFCSACGKPVFENQSTPPPVPQVPPIPVVSPFTITSAPSAPPPPIPTPSVSPFIPSNTAASQVKPEVEFTPEIPPAPLATEHVVSVIGMVTRKTGLFSSELYHMVITDKRLIFALQTKEMQTEDVKKAKDEAKQKGGNFLKQIGAQMSTRYGDKYMGASPDLILAENPQNFTIDLNQVVKVSTFHGDFEDNSPDTLEIKTTTQKLKFNISNHYSVDKQLKEVLGSKVR